MGGYINGYLYPMAEEKPVKRYFIEGLLIIFSVLLALMLDKAVEVYQTRKERDAARVAIIAELEANARIVDELSVSHAAIIKTLEDLLGGKNDSLKKVMVGSKTFDIRHITANRSIASQFASSTAWETARSTGIISEFDYAEVEELTRIYQQQEIIFKGTLSSIVQLLFERDTQDMSKLDGTLLQLNLRFHEIVAQESSLQYYYKKWREKLKANG